MKGLSVHRSGGSSSGRIQKAPENFLDREGIRTVIAESKSGRRNFIRQAFAAAAAGAAVPLAVAQSNPVPSEGGDPNILNLPDHAKGLGQGVAAEGGYGKPSQYEINVQRWTHPNHTGICVFCAFAIFVWHRHAEWLAFRAPPPRLVGY